MNFLTTKRSQVGQLVESFLEGRSDETLRAYRRDLEDFGMSQGLGGPESAVGSLLASGAGPANALAIRYRAELKSRGLAPATVNRRLAALRSIVRLARTVGLVNWSLEVRNVRSRAYRDTRGPGVDVFRRMLDSTGGVGPQAARDRAILWLLYSPALRRGEVAGLDLADVEADGSVWILGKGRAEQERVTLPRKAREALGAWIAARGDHPGPLFTVTGNRGRGGRLSAVGIWRVVNAAGRRAGATVRPHGLRHTGITEAVKAAQRAGYGIEEVLPFSRHANVSTLMLYRDAETNRAGELAGMVAAAA